MIKLTLNSFFLREKLLVDVRFQKGSNLQAFGGGKEQTHVVYVRDVSEGF